MNTEQRILEAVVRMEGMGSDISDIKGTLKEMTVALNKLAIVEERQSQDRSALDRVFKGFAEHEVRIKKLELAQPLQQQTTDWVTKIIWLVVGAVVSAALSFVVVSRASARPAPHAVVNYQGIGGGSGDISMAGITKMNGGGSSC